MLGVRACGWPPRQPIQSLRSSTAINRTFGRVPDLSSAAWSGVPKAQLTIAIASTRTAIDGRNPGRWEVMSNSWYQDWGKHASCAMTRHSPQIFAAGPLSRSGSHVCVRCTRSTSFGLPLLDRPQPFAVRNANIWCESTSGMLLKYPFAISEHRQRLPVKYGSQLGGLGAGWGRERSPSIRGKLLRMESLFFSQIATGLRPCWIDDCSSDDKPL